MDLSAVLSSFFGAALGVFAGLASERLKARISGEFWVAQERWSLKKETYSELLKMLFGQKWGVQKVLKILDMAEAAGGDNRVAQGEVVKILSEEVGGAARRIRELRVVGALWLRPETLAALDTVDQKLSQTRLADPAAIQAIDDAIQRVLAEAKHDLRLDVRGI